MDWKDLGRGLVKALPLLGGALLGPGGAAVGGLVASALGVDATPDEVAQAVRQDPQAAVKLREIETRHREALERLALDRARLELDARRAELADVADARAAEVRRLQAGGWRANGLTYAVGAIVCAGFFWAFWTVAGPEPPEGEAALLMTGGLISAFTQVVQYLFGSSAGSKAKDAVVAALAGRSAKA